MKKILPFIAVSLLALSTYAQRLIQEADTNIIRYGEPIHFRYGVAPLNGLSMAFLPVEMLDEDSLSILSVSTPDSVNNGLFQSINFTAFDSGLYSLPAQAYVLGKDTLYTETFDFYCLPVEVDTSSKAIFGYKEAFEAEWTFSDSLRYYKTEILIVFAIILALILAYFVYKKYGKHLQKDLSKNPDVPTLSFEDWITQELQRIEEQKLWQKTDLKPYFSELNYLLRSFLNHRFQIRALEATSSEILSQLRYSSLSVSEKETINQTLNLTDLVKYAKENPTHEENLRHLNWLKSFINTHLITQEKEEDTNEQA